MKTLIRFAHVLLITASCIGPGGFAQTSDSRTSAQTSKSWLSTSDLESKNLNPIRIIESHSQTGDRTMDTRSIETRGVDGRMEPYQDIERETLQADANTVRVTTRTFARDVNRSKTLVQVTEEEKRALPNGNSKIVRLTSNPDLSGKLQPVQRDVVDMKGVGTDVEETDTTVMLLSINGGLAPALKTHELRKRVANDDVETTKTTFLIDGGGHWQVNEVRQAISRQEGGNRITEERISRLDSAGKLGEVSRVVKEEAQSAAGEKRNTVETYSAEVPGTTSDGRMHLVERNTITQRVNLTGEQITEKQVEKLNAGDPASGLHVSILSSESVRSGPSGEQATVTIRARDADGSFGIVSVDTRKFDRIPTIQVQQTPSQQPK